MFYNLRVRPHRVLTGKEESECCSTLLLGEGVGVVVRLASHPFAGSDGSLQSLHYHTLVLLATAAPPFPGTYCILMHTPQVQFVSSPSRLIVQGSADYGEVGC